MIKSLKYFLLSIFCACLCTSNINAQMSHEKLRQACVESDYEKIEKAIKKKKVDIKGSIGNEMLLISSKKGDDKMVGLLINGGADVNSTDFVGRGPLMCATAYEQSAVAELLKENGANSISAITKRDYDCMAHDELKVGLTYAEVQKLVGKLELSIINAMQQKDFEIEVSHLEKYRFRSNKLTYWRHPCKTSKERLAK